MARGLNQLDGYLVRLGLDRGVLVIFDRRAGSGPPIDRTRFDQATSP